jgi:hypothetical protein
VANLLETLLFLALEKGDLFGSENRPLIELSRIMENGWVVC